MKLKVMSTRNTVITKLINIHVGAGLKPAPTHYAKIHIFILRGPPQADCKCS